MTHFASIGRSTFGGISWKLGQWCSLRKNGSYLGMARSTSLRASSLAVPSLATKISSRAIGATIKKAGATGCCAYRHVGRGYNENGTAEAAALIRTILLHCTTTRN